MSSSHKSGVARSGVHWHAIMAILLLMLKVGTHESHTKSILGSLTPDYGYEEND